MKFFEGFLGNKKVEKREGRVNAGEDTMTIPEVIPNVAHEDELDILEKNRLKIEHLEKKIVEIENDPNHPEYYRLEWLRKELRSKLEPIQ